MTDLPRLTLRLHLGISELSLDRGVSRRGIGGNVMRLRATYVAVLALAASGAFAQEIRLPSGQVVPEAPVGHRQPAIKDLPPDVVREEGRPESPPTQESQKENKSPPTQESQKENKSPPTQESQKDNTGRRLKTCPGCAGGPPTLQVEPSCEAAGSGSVVAGRNKDSCLADENTARDTLKQNWPKY
jgi:type IV secretory pathway VirB10-like protein